MWVTAYVLYYEETQKTDRRTGGLTQKKLKCKLPVEHPIAISHWFYFCVLTERYVNPFLMDLEASSVY